MGKPTGFLEKTRSLPPVEPSTERIKHYDEFVGKPSAELIEEQASRCMDCGIPFCHSGCPLGNIIPEFNDAVYKGEWETAVAILTSTNNFPEFTGRICPAPCESACVLGINQPPVTIEFIEKTIIEKGFEMGIIKPKVPTKRSGKRVAIVGSGPSGLACADQLNKAGHEVTIFERAEEAGGLLRYGIPDFKLGKSVVQRRVDLMKQEGIRFQFGTEVGVDIRGKELLADFDAVVLCVGSTVPRDLQIGGRDLKGIHFAMDFLSQQNHRNAKKSGTKNHQGRTVEEILAKDKHVIVIGGGDTGSDCVGTSNRHGASSIVQIEVLSKPPEDRSPDTPWPLWPHMLRTSSSHEEGADRRWGLSPKAFIGDEKGVLKKIQFVQMGWSNDEKGTPKWQAQAGTEFELPCDLALLAIGFLHPDHQGLLDELGLAYDERSNVKTDTAYRSSVDKVFVAGDCRRGQSLVVWAISEGRECAYHVDCYLMGSSHLERKEKSLLAVV